MRYTYETDGPIEVDVRVPAGSIDVDAGGDGAEVEIRPLNGKAEELVEEVEVGFDGRVLRVEVPRRRLLAGRQPEFEVTVRCPERSRVRAQSASADLVTRGVLGGLEASTASGDASVAEVDGDVRVNSASGDLSVEGVSGRLELHTASGDLRVRRVDGDLRAQAVSGDVRVDEASGRVELTTVSGDLRLDGVSGGPVRVNSVSGDVDVAVVPGTAVYLDLRSISGDTTSELAASDAPAGDEHVVEITGKTVSGDVRVGRAAARA